MHAMSAKRTANGMTGKTVRLPTDTLVELEAEARRHRWTSSQLIRIVLEDWAKKNRKRRAA